MSSIFGGGTVNPTPRTGSITELVARTLMDTAKANAPKVPPPVTMPVAPGEASQTDLTQTTRRRRGRSATILTDMTPNPSVETLG